MADCECLPRCPFFNETMDNMPVMAEITKARYCQGDNRACARHMVFLALGEEIVPIDLFPNEVVRAQEIVVRAGSVPD